MKSRGACLSCSQRPFRGELPLINNTKCRRSRRGLKAIQFDVDQRRAPLIIESNVEPCSYDGLDRPINFDTRETRCQGTDAARIYSAVGTLPSSAYGPFCFSCAKSESERAIKISSIALALKEAAILRKKKKIRPVEKLRFDESNRWPTGHVTKLLQINAQSSLKTRLATRLR